MAVGWQNLEDSVAHAPLEHEDASEHRCTRSISKFIEYLGNMLIMMEFALIVYINIKVVRDIQGWQGVACVVFMLPLCIMILLLTRLLTQMFMKKYAMANFN